MDVLTEKDSFCLELMVSKRLFAILHAQVKEAPFFNEKLYHELITYIDRYIQYHELSIKEVAKFYRSYIKAYNKDARAFEETGNYPLEIDVNREAPERVAYDIILLLSTFLTPHRFRIMQLIQEKSVFSENGLIIGCGPGLEIELLQNKLKKAVAYDLSLAPFLPHFFKEKVIFKKEYFDGSGSERYDSIYLIEILEHLSEPYDLLANCGKVLTENGKIYLTTATNIPQFDHLYKFEADHIDFDNTIKKMGFKIDYSETIVHDFITKGIGSMNKFYILSKNQA